MSEMKVREGRCEMRTAARVRIVMLGGWLAAGMVCVAQGGAAGMRPGGMQKPSAAIPATAPTNVPQPGPAQASALGVASAREAKVMHRAQVNYAGGQLAVRADNSSLNGILRDVARMTGMKITGGVADERVYGSYGPGEPGAVLATLLNGTGSNMVLINDAKQEPQELVLTPRTGGVSPPNPMAAALVDETDLPPQLTPRVPNVPIPGGPAAQAQRERGPQQGFVPVPGAAAPGAPPVPASPGQRTTTEQSPNGVRTPQQIYDQLLQLQQQGAKPPQQ